VQHSVVSGPAVSRGFRHEALLYGTEEAFLAGAVPFLTEGIAAGEPALVVLDVRKIELLRDALGIKADGVRFADMAVVGRNPARIIPTWQDFVSRHSERPVRGIGEPIWAGRSEAELIECHWHEALLNLAFDDGPAWQLLCPYDTARLPAAVLERAHTNHPAVLEDGERAASTGYRSPAPVGVLTDPLPDPPASASELVIEQGPLARVRRFVADHAIRAGLSLGHTGDFVLASSEIAANSIRHGGGSAVLRIWQEQGALVCDIRDRGLLTYPLVGRERPPLAQERGRGLWLANQVCDLVQVRSSAEAGTVVRLHMRTD
jgi:anti-sigma regulatory factor (Ser/Thr protein kinase)